MFSNRPQKPSRNKLSFSARSSLSPASKSALSGSKSPATAAPAPDDEPPGVMFCKNAKDKLRENSCGFQKYISKVPCLGTADGEWLRLIILYSQTSVEFQPRLVRRQTLHRHPRHRRPCASRQRWTPATSCSFCPQRRPAWTPSSDWRPFPPWCGSGWRKTCLQQLAAPLSSVQHPSLSSVEENQLITRRKLPSKYRTNAEAFDFGHLRKFWTVSCTNNSSFEPIMYKKN